MKLSFWVDVFPWSDPKNLFVEQHPAMPKQTDAIRYRIDVEIPDWQGEDSVIQAKAEPDRGDHENKSLG